jgi:hypothetical protein
MKRFRLKTPSPALVISVIALVMAMAGTGYALSKNSVGTKQLKNGAVTTKKLHNGAVTTKKIHNGAVTGSKLNLSGVTVPDATSANPTAFARVSPAGALDSANSKNVGSVTHGPVAGYYCIKGLPFTPRGGQATVDWSTSGNQFAQFALGTGGGCPAGTQAFVSTRNPVSDAGFFVELYR